MSIKLDDLLNEKKGPAPVLDLFNAPLTSRTDFEAALAKVPEYKIKPEKVTINLINSNKYVLRIVFRKVLKNIELQAIL